MPDHLTIIVPVFNEEDNVLPMANEVTAAFAKTNQPYELLFVDDASTDLTPRRIEEASAQFPNVRGVRHQVNSGQSAAFLTGLNATESPLIATLDGDLQNDPADLPKLLSKLNRSDFVCGVRAKRQDNWVRILSTRIARLARSLALGVDFADTGCFLRVFHRSALDGVLPFNGWHRFLPVLVYSAGHSVEEVPVNHRPRTAGTSKYGVWNRLWRGIYDLIGVGWLQKRALQPTPTTGDPVGSTTRPSRRRPAPRTKPDPVDTKSSPAPRRRPRPRAKKKAANRNNRSSQRS
ncbi:MAG: glycosyltransferase family 2 protein [Limisphaerales bacterium]